MCDVAFLQGTTPQSLQKSPCHHDFDLRLIPDGPLYSLLGAPACLLRVQLWVLLFLLAKGVLFLCQHQGQSHGCKPKACQAVVIIVFQELPVQRNTF